MAVHAYAWKTIIYFPVVLSFLFLFSFFSNAVL